MERDLAEVCGDERGEEAERVRAGPNVPVAAATMVDARSTPRSESPERTDPMVNRSCPSWLPVDGAGAAICPGAPSPEPVEARPKCAVEDVCDEDVCGASEGSEKGPSLPEDSMANP